MFLNWIGRIGLLQPEGGMSSSKNITAAWPIIYFTGGPLSFEVEPHPNELFL
jgi:hypothetical protein